jgi:hypothetical protein
MIRLLRKTRYRPLRTVTRMPTDGSARTRAAFDHHAQKRTISRAAGMLSAFHTSTTFHDFIWKYDPAPHSLLPLSLGGHLNSLGVL